MAEKDNDTGEDVNLEMPSLGFGSKRRKRKTGTKTGTTEPGTTEPGTAEPGTTETTEPAAPGTFVPPAASTPHSFRPPGEEAADRPLYADEVDDTSVLPASEPQATKSAKPAKPPKPQKPPKPPREKRELNLPEVSGMTVSVATGILVGLLACGATYLALQGCEAVKGTSSCGGPGFFLLVAIMAGLVLAGSFVLKMFRVTDPRSTSFLAVGLLCVIVLLFLVEVIFEWWMFIAIPVIGAATFALSHWVTTTFIEPADRPT